MKLKGKGLFAFTSFLSMIPPLGTDLYMSALPTMVKDLNATQNLGSLTMSIFLLFMATGMLVLGAFSDKWGRKNVLIAASTGALISSLGCAIAPNIYILLALRAVQGFSCGGMVSIATAIIGDTFEGKTRAAALSVSQASAFIAPVIAPIIGVAVFELGGWRAEFAVLAMLMAAAFACSFFLEDKVANSNKKEVRLVEPFISLAQQMKDKTFLKLMAIGGPINAPYMAYLGVASFVFIDYFHETELAFALFFAVASLGAVAGPVAFMHLKTDASAKKVIAALLVVCAMASVFLLILGSINSVVFLCCIIPFIFCSTFLRPMISDMVLASCEGRTGAASSAMNFLFTGIGCIGMFAIAAGWNNYITGIGTIMIVCTAISFLFGWRGLSGTRVAQTQLFFVC